MTSMSHTPHEWALLRTVQAERDRLRMDNATLRAALLAESVSRRAAERSANLLVALIVAVLAAAAWTFLRGNTR